MSDKTTLDFIKTTLKEISSEYQIPEDMIPHLSALLEQFPDTSKPKDKDRLLEALEQQIEKAKNEGLLS